MFDTLITAFEGLEDYQPIPHANFIAIHSSLEDSYLETLVTNQRANCSRFLNQVITEAGICKNDIIELRDLDLL